MPDGSLLMVYGQGKIMLTTSRDGDQWEDPWEYPYNSVFPTGNAATVVDEEGLVWMFYLSKRPGTDRFSSGNYYLWRSSSPDGRHWSRPCPVQTPGLHQYQNTVQITRHPDGRSWLFLNNQVGAADSPGAIDQLTIFWIPVRYNWIPAHTHAQFDDRGRCHAVFCGPNFGAFYSWSDDMQLWHEPIELFRERASQVHLPQLILDDQHVVLYHEANSGAWFRRGVLHDDGPRFSGPIQIADHRLGISNARVMREGERITIPVAGSRPLLLQADRAELLSDRSN
jgi:hypothetical protein